MFLIGTVPVENFQSCKEIFVFPLFNVLVCFRILHTLSLSLSGYCSSDSEGHFDTPEEATPVRSIPGELENSSDPDRTGKSDKSCLKNAISSKHLLSFVVYLKRPYTNNNNCKSSWELMKHSSVCALQYQVHNGRVT